MTKHIALKSINDHLLLRYSPFVSLKQEVLLFDKIGVLNLHAILDMCFESDTGKRAANSLNLSREQLMDIEWLIENEIVFDAKLPSSPKEKFDVVNNIDEYRYLWDSYYISFQRMCQAVLAASKKLTETEMVTDVKSFTNESLTNTAIALRLVAIHLETGGQVNVFPLLPYSEYVKEIPKSKKSDVIQVVIGKLPLPDNNTPWEQILDFRADSDNQKNLLALRRWIRKISSENLTRGEIEDELQWLINEFESQMKLHKMKANTETIETCIKAPLEIIEDIVKFKWSKIPDPFFALTKRKTVLLEAEMNSPGKEIAYLVKAKEAFDGE